MSTAFKCNAHEMGAGDGTRTWSTGKEANAYEDQDRAAVRHPGDLTLQERNHHSSRPMQQQNKKIKNNTTNVI